ncbi:hypothetical protein OR60_15405 [Xanthomonas vesicatoria]|uniref:Uncharacterized protein n=2 Tax=Xanthomonas vesicatoria TaxID=56460 RepID=A0AAJ0IWE7_9XANT|nr:hypothetical protein OR61_17300 [Xanthomonas vesicatoria]KHM92868.1 hypothetical protein OR60_15405 [Xanthomonas vesicatoria]
MRAQQRYLMMLQARSHHARSVLWWSLFKRVATMDFDSSQQLRILRDIHDTKPVSDEEGSWAVRAGYATQAEDGDIDLTHEGRKALDDGQA